MNSSEARWTTVATGCHDEPGFGTSVVILDWGNVCVNGVREFDNLARGTTSRTSVQRVVLVSISVASIA